MARAQAKGIYMGFWNPTAVKVRVFFVVPCLIAAACSTQHRSTLDPVDNSSTAMLSAPPSRGKADFARVSASVAPSAKAVCEELSPKGEGRSCDFAFVLSADPKLPPNAYQSENAAGRPIVTMTKQLLERMQTDDEIAFVLSHEAAHHAIGHIDKLNGSVAYESFLSDHELLISSGAATARGTYSNGAHQLTNNRSIELEADWVGTFISERSGYSAASGGRIFARSVDLRESLPSKSALSSHPTPKQRLGVISTASAEIRRQRNAGAVPRVKFADLSK